MHYRRILIAVALALFTVMSAVNVMAQDDDCSTKSFDIWLNCQVAQAAGARLNQQATNKRPEAPSVASNTTSLVDQTASPDLLGLALNLAGLSGNSKDTGTDNTSMNFTTSAYAVYAAFLHQDPLDPAFYRRHPNLRRLYFSLGQETPEGEDAVDKNRATLAGVKYLIINRRDVSVPTNRRRLDKMVSDSLAQATSDFAGIANDVQDYLYLQLVPVGERGLTPVKTFVEDRLDNFQAEYAKLTPDQLKAVRDIIANRIESRVIDEQNTLKTINKIRGAPQLAFTFDSKLRKADGTDEYRAGLAFDYGVTERMNITLNGTFNYADSKTVGGDTRGGRIAGEGNFKLSRDRNPFSGAGPFMFTVSGESKWMSNDKTTHTGQLKLTIPIFDGVSFPISLSVANRSELIKEKTVRGRFGFSFDFTKLFNKLQK